MTERAHSSKQHGRDKATQLLPLPDPERTFAEQEPDVLLALCVFGEARGESDAAQRAVAQVVVNRARFPHAVFGARRDADFADNLRRVILKPQQFSCFLPSPS
jgi:spore germination cell wall hydrolase CwlJ-like protein